MQSFIPLTHLDHNPCSPVHDLSALLRDAIMKVVDLLCNVRQ